MHSTISPVAANPFVAVATSVAGGELTERPIQEASDLLQLSNRLVSLAGGLPELRTHAGGGILAGTAALAEDLDLRPLVGGGSVSHARVGTFLSLGVGDDNQRQERHAAPPK